MPGPAVTVVESGGLPVRAVEARAPAMTVVESGGRPVTITERGTPFILQGLVPPVDPPGAISDLAVLNTTTSTIALSFTNAQYATSHEYSLDGGAWQSLATDKIITGLDAATEYLVRVRGVNSVDNGPPSNEVEGETEAVTPFWQSVTMTAGNTAFGWGYAIEPAVSAPFGSINRQPYTGGTLLGFWEAPDDSRVIVIFAGDIVDELTGQTFEVDGTPLAVDTAPEYNSGSDWTIMFLEAHWFEDGEEYTIERVPIAPEGIQYGRTDNFDAGTEFDYIVASDGSGDFTTLNAAWDQAVADAAVRSIGVRDMGARYREKLVKTNYSGPGITISSYGTEKPVISGALRVTGFEVCDSGDEALVGPEYADIYKATISTSSLEHTSYHALIPTEDGQLLDLVQRRQDESNLFILDEYGTFFSQAVNGCTATLATVRTGPSNLQRGSGTSDPLGKQAVSAIIAVNQGGTWNGTSFTGGTTYAAGTDYTLSGNSISWEPAGAEPATSSTYQVVFDHGVLGTITHPAVLDAYTDTQLAACAVSFHAIPNEAHFVKVASASDGVLTIAPNQSVPQGDGNFKYSLLNILPELATGQWGYVDNGDGTVTLYVRPNDPANIDKIDVAARINAINLFNCQNVTIRGIVAEQTSGTAAAAGIPIRVEQCPDVLVEEVEIRKYSHDAKGYGAIYMRSCDRGMVRKSYAWKGQSCFGFYLNGGTDPRGRNLLIEDVTQSPIRGYAGTRMVFADIRPIRCGAGAHANLGNNYEQAVEPLVIGYNPPTTLADRPVKGYYGIQETAGFTVMHSILPMGPDARALVDQYNNTAPPYDPSENFAINCMIPQAPDRVASSTPGAASAVLCNPLWELNWTLANSIVPIAKIYDSSPAVGTLTRLNNILTNQDPVDGSETRVDPLAVYFNPAVGDFRAIPGSTWLTKEGVDLSGTVTALAVKYPDLADRLYQDINGNPWNPADPGIGPWGKNPPVATDTTPPVISDLNTSVSGTNVSIFVTTDKFGGYLHYELDNGVDAPITGTQWVPAVGVQEIALIAPDGTYDLTVYHEDRFGNISNELTGTVEVSGYEPVWTLMNGGDILSRSTGLTGAQASTRSMLFALTIQFSAAQIAAAASSSGISRSLPSTDGQHQFSTTLVTSNKRMTFVLRGAGGNTILANYTIPVSGTLVADTPYLVLLSGAPSGASDIVIRGLLIQISDGSTVATAGPTTVAGALKFSDTTTFEIGRFDQNPATDVGASFERYVLWDNATADITDVAVQQLFADGGDLQDGAVARDAIGAALIEFVGPAMATGINGGTGGNFTVV